MSGKDDTEEHQRRYRAPFSEHNPIPTVQRYRKEKEERDAAFGATEDDGLSRTQRAKDAYANYKHGEQGPRDGEQPYRSENKNTGVAVDEVHLDQSDDKPQKEEPGEGSDLAEDTSEVDISKDPKQQRKDMKKRKDDAAEREVTDPVTHLPVRIHDFTSKDLKNTPENEPPPGLGSRVGTEQSLGDHPEDSAKIKADMAHQQNAHSSLDILFPPPNFEAVKQDLTRIYERALLVGLGTVALCAAGVPFLLHLVTVRGTRSDLMSLIWTILSIGVSVVTIWTVSQWARNKANDVWENETWEAERQANKPGKNHVAESTQWLNSLLSSIWPLVNPDLFTALSDTLEDILQQSLPSMVRMVAVEDIGQGSESFRILGVKWLPSGAAAQSVDEHGKIQSKKPNKESDRKVLGQGQVEQTSEGSDRNDNQSDGNELQDEDKKNVAEGMEAEEGDFVNLEIAFAYRARGQARGIRSRAKHAHLYLAFYLFGGVKFPVWVELHGFVGVLRCRLQLTPDPPFISLCTMTFMGQPKVDMSCVPLSQHAMNLMDLPIISNFVQSAVDAGLSTLVAPRNLTLDLKDMLVGDDFKKDTNARGVLMITIRRGFDFKEGDSGIGPLKKGSSDPYVSVGWAKYAKPVWSTRVMLSEMQPWWQETAFILVTPEELNVDERIRVQLWDSDRTSADDDLGRIEVDLKHIMRNEQSNGRMWERQDGFKALKKDEDMPGKLEWSIGYFSKTRLQESQLAAYSKDSNIKTVEDLKRKVHAEAESKLREARKDETRELEQQQAQDLKEREDEIITCVPPSQEYPSGILSIQVHQITGLELETLRKNDTSKKDTAEDEDEEGDDLPSSYCTIILNHQKIYKTRTKPKNAKPFFNAGTERLIRDWRNTEVHVSVRDSRVHENDPLLGIVYLPLGEILSKRSQISEFFPLAGGVGYGRIRISLVFRSVQLQAPRELLGWDFGTIEIQPKITAGEGVSTELQSDRLKIRTNLGKGKMKPSSGAWTAKSDTSIKLPVRRRYASNLIFEFRSDSTFRDSTDAFCVLWLKDIPDEEEKTLHLTAWKGKLSRAEQNCLEEYGEKLGTIELTLKFWPGLSGFHSKFASKDPNIANVMEVLDVACDNDGEDMNFIHGDKGDTDTSSDSSSDDSDTPTTTNSEKSDDDGKRGVIDSVKDYKDNRKQLHRRNRGLMQWKAPRTANWLKSKVNDVERKATSMFKHSEREPGIETEA